MKASVAGPENSDRVTEKRTEKRRAIMLSHARRAAYVRNVTCRKVAAKKWAYVRNVACRTVAAKKWAYVPKSGREKWLAKSGSDAGRRNAKSGEKAAGPKNRDREKWLARTPDGHEKRLAEMLSPGGRDS